LRSLSIFLALAFVWPLAHAGDANDPEIRDGSRDVDPDFVSIALGAPEIDLLAVWFDANDTTVAFHWQVVDASHRLFADEGRSFALTFRCGSDEAAAIVTLLPAFTYQGESYPPESTASVTVYHPDNGTTEGEDSAAWETGNVAHAEAPRSLFRCVSFTQEIATTNLLIHEGNGQWGGPSGSGWFRDIAPDQGYGRDFALG